MSCHYFTASGLQRPVITSQRTSSEKADVENRIKPEKSLSAQKTLNPGLKSQRSECWKFRSKGKNMGYMVMTMSGSEAIDRLWELHCLHCGASMGATRVLYALHGGIRDDTAIRMMDIFRMDEYFQPAALELIHRRFMCEFDDLRLPKNRWYSVLRRMGIDTSDPDDE